jgi:hypothetical protein
MSACEVVDADGKPCQGTDIQLHHWAPKCLFGDEAELWPKSYLCRDHHNMWHTGTRTRHVAKEFGPIVARRRVVNLWMLMPAGDLKHDLMVKVAHLDMHNSCALAGCIEQPLTEDEWHLARSLIAQGVRQVLDAWQERRAS